MNEPTRYNFEDHYQIVPDSNGTHVVLTYAAYTALRDQLQASIDLAIEVDHQFEPLNQILDEAGIETDDEAGCYGRAFRQLFDRMKQAEQDRDVLGAEARASREHERIVSLPLFDPTNPDFPNPHRDVKRARAMLAVFMTQTNLSGALTRCGPVPSRDLTLCPHGHSRTLECEDCKPASGGEEKR